MSKIRAFIGRYQLFEFEHKVSLTDTKAHSGTLKGEKS